MSDEHFNVQLDSEKLPIVPVTKKIALPAVKKASKVAAKKPFLAQSSKATESRLTDDDEKGEEVLPRIASKIAPKAVARITAGIPDDENGNREMPTVILRAKGLSMLRAKVSTTLKPKKGNILKPKAIGFLDYGSAHHKLLRSPNSGAEENSEVEEKIETLDDDTADEAAIPAKQIEEASPKLKNNGSSIRVETDSPGDLDTCAVEILSTHSHWGLTANHLQNKEKPTLIIEDLETHTFPMVSKKEHKVTFSYFVDEESSVEDTHTSSHLVESPQEKTSAHPAEEKQRSARQMVDDGTGISDGKGISDLRRDSPVDHTPVSPVVVLSPKIESSLSSAIDPINSAMECQHLDLTIISSDRLPMSNDLSYEVSSSSNSLPSSTRRFMSASMSSDDEAAKIDITESLNPDSGVNQEATGLPNSRQSNRPSSLVSRSRAPSFGLPTFSRTDDDEVVPFPEEKLAMPITSEPTNEDSAENFAKYDRRRDTIGIYDSLPETSATIIEQRDASTAVIEQRDASAAVIEQIEAGVLSKEPSGLPDDAYGLDNLGFVETPMSFLKQSIQAFHMPEEYSFSPVEEFSSCVQRPMRSGSSLSGRTPEDCDSATRVSKRTPDESDHSCYSETGNEEFDMLRKSTDENMDGGSLMSSSIVERITVTAPESECSGAVMMPYVREIEDFNRDDDESEVIREEETVCESETICGESVSSSSVSSKYVDGQSRLEQHGSQPQIQFRWPNRLENEAAWVVPSEEGSELSSSDDEMNQSRPIKDEDRLTGMEILEVIQHGLPSPRDETTIQESMSSADKHTSLSSNYHSTVREPMLVDDYLQTEDNIAVVIGLASDHQPQIVADDADLKVATVSFPIDFATGKSLINTEAILLVTPPSLVTPTSIVSPTSVVTPPPTTTHPSHQRWSMAQELSTDRGISHEIAQVRSVLAPVNIARSGSRSINLVLQEPNTTGLFNSGLTLKGLPATELPTSVSRTYPRLISTQNNQQPSWEVQPEIVQTNRNPFAQSTVYGVPQIALKRQLQLVEAPNSTRPQHFTTRPSTARATIYSMNYLLNESQSNGGTVHSQNVLGTSSRLRSGTSSRLDSANLAGHEAKSHICANSESSGQRNVFEDGKFNLQRLSQINGSLKHKNVSCYPQQIPSTVQSPQTGMYVTTNLKTTDMRPWRSSRPPMAAQSIADPAPARQNFDTSKPISFTSKPISHTPKPISFTSKPISHTPKPISFTSKPISHTPKPISITSKPISITSQPISHTPNSITPTPISQTPTPSSHPPTPISHTATPKTHTATPKTHTATPISHAPEPITHAPEPKNHEAKPISHTVRPIAHTPRLPPVPYKRMITQPRSRTNGSISSLSATILTPSPLARTADQVFASAERLGPRRSVDRLVPESARHRVVISRGVDRFSTARDDRFKGAMSSLSFDAGDPGSRSGVSRSIEMGAKWSVVGVSPLYALHKPAPVISANIMRRRPVSQSGASVLGAAQIREEASEIRQEKRKSGLPREKTCKDDKRKTAAVRHLSLPAAASGLSPNNWRADCCEDRGWNCGW